jgi:hypothetical protein
MLVVCGECGWRMECNHARPRAPIGTPYEYFYYNCRHAGPLEGGPVDPAARCRAKRVRRDELDGVVWDAIVSWIQSPRMLMEEIQAWRASRAGFDVANRDRIRLERVQQQLDVQIERLVDAYQRGAVTVDELKTRRERLEAEQKATQTRIEELSAAELDRSRLDRLGEDLEAFASTLRHGLDNLDFDGRQRLIRLLVERVVVTGDKVAIEHAIPLTGRFCGFAFSPSTSSNAHHATPACASSAATPTPSKPVRYSDTWASPPRRPPPLAPAIPPRFSPSPTPTDPTHRRADALGTGHIVLRTLAWHACSFGVREPTSHNE